MCSRVECENGLLCQESGREIILDDVSNKLPCCKCQKLASVHIPRAGCYCNDCLLASVTHKFRGCLGKSKIVRKNEKVLIAYSGSMASTLLLYLVKNMIEESTYRRISITPVIFYVDETIMHEEDHQLNTNNLKEIYDCTKQFGFEIYVAPFECAMQKSDLELSRLLDGSELMPITKNSDALRIQIKSLFQSISNQTSKDDLFLKLRLNLLTNAAVSLNCSKIFVGDSRDLLAVRLLSDIALGKGNSLSKEIGVFDIRCNGVTLVRPLREISAKEIAFCVNFLIVKNVLKLPHIKKERNQNSSIQKLTEKFVLGLQHDFPATVSTIFRTGDKLGLSSKPCEIQSEDVECVMCSNELNINPIENFDHKTGAESCTRCSQMVLEKNFDCKQLATFCCYSCRLIIKDMASLNSLSLNTIEKVVNRIEKIKIEDSTFSQ